jgi:ADP-ribose pyrophosphatase YjhB (NUDIX family)
MPTAESHSDMDILPLLDALRTIACNGLNFATDPYDRERYERLLDLASAYYGQALDLPSADVRGRLRRELGYVTPKVGAEAAIFDPDGRILLVRRSDDGRWCLPCGWVEPNESPAEAAVRETREETGLVVRPTRLVDVFTRKPADGHGPHTAVAVAYLCEVVEGSIRGSHEVTEVRYRRIEDVSGWHELHRRYAEAAYAVWREGESAGRSALSAAGDARPRHDRVPQQGPRAPEGG